MLVWPHYLCYTNELWGGTAAGYRVVNDSNCDWGQGLKELAQWQKEHAASPLTMWYFGTDPSQFRLPIRNVQFQGLTIKDADDLVRQVQGGYLAVSVSYLQTGDRCSEAQKLAAQFLRGQPPVARTMTFLIYDFTHLEGGAEEAESKKVLMND